MPLPEDASLPEKLGFRLELLEWIFRLHPLCIFVVYAVISPGLMWLNDLLFVHGRFLHLDEQWLAARLTFLFGGAIGVLAAMMRDWPLRDFPDWLRRTRTQLLATATALAVNGLRVWYEQKDVPILERAQGMNWLYFNLALPVLIGYPLIILLLAAGYVFYRRQAWKHEWMCIGALVVIACFVALHRAGVYDAAHQFAPSGVSKHDLANPADPWRDGLVPQALRWVQDWLEIHLTPLFPGD